MNHPSILAFGYSYLPTGADEPSYAIVSASSLKGFQALTYDLDSVVLRDVHHVSDQDSFTLTDIIWNGDHVEFPYRDEIAENSWAFADMDRIANGES